MFGENKKLINNYLTSLLKKDSKALVIDTEKLGSTRILSKKLRKKNIHVFGIDPCLEKACTRFGVVGKKMWSESALAFFGKNKYDLIFLDYCGTPDGSEHFNPNDDLQRASRMLKRRGILAVTFSKRCSSLLSKCINMRPRGLHLQRAFPYFDTSGMVLVLYSAREIRQIGPRKGSLVKVGKWVGRVDELYIDGAKLTHMVYSKQKWRPHKQQHPWEESFIHMKPLKHGRN